MKFRRLALVMIAALPVAACASPGARTPASFGLALQQDLAAQIVSPQGAQGPAPAANGPREALAMARYQAGKTLPPGAAASQVGKAAAPASGSGAP